MHEILTVTEAAQYLKRTVVCLQQWDRRGKLKSHRTDSNRRYYFKHELDNFLGIEPVQEHRSIVVYARVSSTNQKSDLKNQINILNDYVRAKAYSNVLVFEEIGGGLNFKRKKFNEILDLILGNKIEKLIITHKDRLCRFGFDLIKGLCDKFNVEIEVITLDKDSPETEMVKDLMTIIHCFSSRLYGLRNYRKELKKRLESNT
jgi:putative resolvase